MSALEPFKVMLKQEFYFSMPKTSASFCRAGHTVLWSFFWINSHCTCSLPITLVGILSGRPALMVVICWVLFWASLIVAILASPVSTLAGAAGAGS